MASAGYTYYPYDSTTAFFHNGNGANPGFLNLRPDHPLPPDLDLAFLPQHFTILSSTRGFILCRDVSNGSYHLFDPLYPHTVGHKHIPDPPNPHPGDTPAVIILRSEKHCYKIVCAIHGGKAGYRFDTFDSYSGNWTMGGLLDRPHARLLANTGVSWGSWACWLTEAPPQYAVMYNTDTSDIGFPRKVYCGPEVRLQLGRLGGDLGLVAVDDSDAIVYRLVHVVDEQHPWQWEEDRSVEVQMLPAVPDAADAGCITNEHQSPKIVCRQTPQPLRFESFKVEVLFLVDGRLVLWESTELDDNHRVTAIGGPPPNVQQVPVAFCNGSAIPYVISCMIPPAGVWPSNHPGGFNRH